MLYPGTVTREYPAILSHVSDLQPLGMQANATWCQFQVVIKNEDGELVKMLNAKRSRLPCVSPAEEIIA